MQTASSFLRFFEGEQILEEWEFLSDSGQPSAKEVLAAVLVLFLGIVPLRMAGNGPLEETVVFLLLGIMLIGTAVWMFWLVATRPEAKGYLCLTNWRIIYYEVGTGSRFRRRYHHASMANLKDVLGVHVTYNERRFGVRHLALHVHTRFEDGMVVAIEETGRVLSKVPLIGKAFLRTTIGKDAYLVIPILFRLIQERQLAAIDTDSEY
jgi:hypothetical protein